MAKIKSKLAEKMWKIDLFCQRSEIAAKLQVGIVKKKLQEGTQNRSSCDKSHGLVTLAVALWQCDTSVTKLNEPKIAIIGPKNCKKVAQV